MKSNIEDGIPRELTQYGFIFGVANVKRLFTGDKGEVYLGIETPKETIEIYVTKTGKIRIWSKKPKTNESLGEWEKPKKK